MTGDPGAPPAPDLIPLPDRLRERRPAVPADVLDLVAAEHARWRALHDRLIAMIAALIDVAAADGRPVVRIIDEVVAATSVPLDDLVGAGIDAAEIAGLLRAHGSTGVVRTEGATTTFEHQCGTGLRYWRDNPTTPVVAAGEVPGVPAGSPRYCARCIRTIDGHGPSGPGEPAWAVVPPADPSGHCTWIVTERAHAPDNAATSGPAQAASES